MERKQLQKIKAISNNVTLSNKIKIITIDFLFTSNNVLKKEKITCF